MSGLSTGAIIGIVVGILAFVLIKLGETYWLFALKSCTRTYYFQTMPKGIIVLTGGYFSAALIYTLCKRRRQRISKQGARSTKKDSPEEIEAFLRQLKEHEFACHDIK